MSLSFPPPAQAHASRWGYVCGVSTTCASATLLCLALGLATGVAGASEQDEAETAPAVQAEAADPVRRSSGSTLTIFGSREAVNTTPGSGFYLDGADLRAKSIDNIDQALRRVPGVYTRQEDGYGLFPNISIRGVSQMRSSKVSIMEDGILMAPAPYSAPAAYYTLTVGRMAGIEVLKGSSQVRYGPHITGGVVNYLSNPIPEQSTGYAKAVYGENNDMRLHAHYGDTVSLSNGSRIGYVVEGYFRQADGFKRFSGDVPDARMNERPGFRNMEPMAKVMWEPGGPFYQRLELKYGYTDREANFTYLGLTEADFKRDPHQRYAATRFDHIDTEQHRGSLHHHITVSEAFTIDSTIYATEFSRNWYKLNNVRELGGSWAVMSRALAEDGVHADIMRGTAEGDLRVRANARDYSSRGIQIIPRYEMALGDTYHQFELGLRWHADEMRRKQYDAVYRQNANGGIVSRSDGAPGSESNREEKARALAIYVQDRISYGPLTVVPGLRLERVDMEYTDYSTALAPADVVVAEGDGSLTMWGASLGATFDVTAEVQLFGGIHRGFSPPGPRASIRDDIKEETSLSQELGLRYQDRERALSLEVAFFYTQFKDLIAVDNAGGGGGSAVGNFGKADSMGLELSVDYDPGTALEWGFALPTFVAYTYTNAKLQSDSQGTNDESIFAGGRKGNRVPYIPDHQLSLGTGIHYGRYGIGASANYTSSQCADGSNTTQQVNADGDPDSRYGKIASRIIVDLNLHVQVKDGFKVLGGIDNVFDEQYVASRLPHGPRPGQSRFAHLGFEIDF